MAQSNAYKYVNEINYVADLVGADLPRDLLNVGIQSSEVPLDVTATTVPTTPDTKDFTTFNTIVDADGESNVSVSATGATMLVGYVERQEAYTVSIQWTNGSGETYDTEEVVKNGSGANTFVARMQTPHPNVRITDKSGTDDTVRGSLHTTTSATNGATEGTLQKTLTREIAEWSAGVLSVQQDSPLDVSGATVAVQEDTPLDIADRDDRNLGDVDVTTLPDSDESAATGSTVAASSSLSVATLSGKGANRLLGQVVSSGTYDLDVEWLDSPGGTVVRTEGVASGVAGGTWTDIDLPARSPYCSLVVTDTSGAEQTADHTAHLT